MTAKKVDRNAARIRQQHIVARRAELRHLIARAKAGIASGATFDAVHCLAMLRILETVKEGRDARERFGIKPKRGAPLSTRGFQLLIAAHYWALRRTESETDARESVADLWGCSASRAWNIAQPRRARSKRILRTMSRENIEAAAREAAPFYKALSAKSRELTD